MLELLLSSLKNIIKSRYLPLVLIYSVFIVLPIYKTFTIQVVNQETLVDSIEENEVITREIKATRGNIYDINGVLLAYNKLSYNVTIQEYDAFKSNDEKNEMIYKLIKILEANKEELSPTFYIKQDGKGKLKFTVDGMAEYRFKRDAYRLKSIEELTTEQRNATAEEVFLHLKNGNYMFGISDKYSIDDALKIMQLRFALLLNTYNRAYPILVAENVSEKTVAAILENSSSLQGIDIAEHTYRVYNDSEYFAHILGYTGSVNETELSNDSENYNLTDQIGKTGIEYAFEEYLRGTKGVEEASLNSKYYVVGTKTVKEPIAGNNIYLTIDSKLQKICYRILEKNIAAVLLSKIHNSQSYGERGVNASNIKIPIYEVYNALFDNGAININRLSKKRASKTEKAVYEKYKDREERVIAHLKEVFDSNKTEKDKDIREYLEYIYSFIKEKEILNVDLVDEEDEGFKEFIEDKLLLNQFLRRAISKRWINLSKLDLGKDYFSTDEIYERLVNKLFSELRNDLSFKKIIYKRLIFDYTISGTEICLILYDQGFLKKDDEMYNKLIAGVVSSYNFIREKIKKLEITPAVLALDPCSGSMVVTEPKTGKIKALVTYPSYDNNKLANKIDAKYYEKLQNDKSLPLINRPCQQKTAPGSTFKIISTAANLGAGVVGEYEKIYDKVIFTKTDKPAACWSRISHGNIDLRTAIEVSCNYFFYETGYRMSLDKDGKYVSKLGLDKLNEYAAMFGFKKGETSGVELYEYEPSISDTDSVRSSIGQGSYAFTPTQISRYISGIANGGKLRYLSIVEDIKDLYGNDIENKVSISKTKKYGNIDLPKTTWDTILDGLYEVVNGDRSQYKQIFKDVKSVVAGKSGTAQFSKNRGDHALFMSYAPYNNPEISVTTVLPYAYGSVNAVRATADFYEYYFNGKDEEILTNKEVEDSREVIIAD